MRSFIEQHILPQVVKPSQYIGDEWNIIRKNWDSCSVKTAFLFPDLYEVGMSHLGLRILYHVVNEREDFLMERSFAPMIDMEQLMREKGIPLFSLESYRPLNSFDILGFTLQYEMSYTNIINMLDLAGLPLRSRDRVKDSPLVMAGGPCALNPEPLAEFIDFFVIGEGEEVILEILDLIKKEKQEHGSLDKERFLQNVEKISGVYVPRFYAPVFDPAGKLSRMEKVREDAPDVVEKRVIKDFSQASFPTRTLVPNTEIIHDRIMLEVLRGCSRGCRFCQAGVIYRPAREREMGRLLDQAEELVGATGYDEIALVSLSSADYTCVEPLIEELTKRFKDKGVGVSLPSLRVDAFSVNLARKVQAVRKSGLTFAPEAGSQRLRDVINKGVTEENILDTVQAAFSQGWTSVKLYFMIGLPTETFEDLDGMVDLTAKILVAGRKMKPPEVRKPVKITVSVSSFVPKAHTPFQWEGQESQESLREKQLYLKERFRKMKNVTFNYHEVETSFLEAAFARGDRRLGDVLEKAWSLGCKFDGWSEHFKYSAWLTAFQSCRLDPEFFANHPFDLKDVLPWERISCGVSLKWLAEEYALSREGKRTPDCRSTPCHGCGVCTRLKVRPEIKGGVS